LADLESADGDEAVAADQGKEGVGATDGGESLVIEMTQADLPVADISVADLSD
jgi:hypothetical protein